jgi:carotenoid 1,2-hydratase
VDGVVQPPGGADPDPGALPRGGEHAPGAGRPDGDALRTSGRGEPRRGPRFDEPVAHGGYAWWYVDALSDDGRDALTLIAFVGGAFSPYYAAARRRGRADPLDHCALNVALYAPGAKRWTLTERPRASVHRAASTLAIGPSSLEWDGAALTVRIDEVTAPLPSRVRGVVRVHPSALTARSFALDAAGAHRWWPIAPRARVEVALERPRLAWRGEGYFDSNAGDAPLEDAFAGWTWSRARVGDGAAVLYDVLRRAGGPCSLALRFDANGEATAFDAPPAVALPRTGWRVAREARTAVGSGATVVRTLEDTPFYARSIVAARLGHEAVTAMHESLSLDRFRSPWVRLLLPFRTPRARR